MPDEVKPAVDKAEAPETNKYTLKCGVELELRPVAPYLIQYSWGDDSERPAPPSVEVKTPDGRTRTESNVFDPDYRQALENWNTSKVLKSYRLLISEGVATDPPDDWEAKNKMRHYFPGATVEDLRYMWINQIATADEIVPLCLAIAGQTVATSAGRAESEKSFRRSSRRKSG